MIVIEPFQKKTQRVASPLPVTLDSCPFLIPCSSFFPPSMEG